MSAPTTLIPAQLVADLASTIMRLRQARAAGEDVCALVAEDRLNQLIDKIPRTPKDTQ